MLSVFALTASCAEAPDMETELATAALVNCQPGGNQIALFRDIQYQGSCTLYTMPSNGILSIPFVATATASFMNDDASSIRGGTDAEAILFDDADLRGPMISYFSDFETRGGTGRDLRSLWGQNFNDRVSSLVVLSAGRRHCNSGYEAGRDNVLVFQHANFGGHCMRYFAGEEIPSILQAGFPNDEVSSIKVGSDVVLDVFEHGNFEGKSEVILSGNAPWMDGTTIGNDSISSLKVRWR
jgi:hypothetical protein